MKCKIVLAFMIVSKLARGSLGFTRFSAASRAVLAADGARDTTTITQQDVLRPLVVCGPSGVGKGTIINEFMENLGGSDKFEFSVSHTSRSPRPGEVDGVHYHFTDVESMKEDVNNNVFIEHAWVHGNLYGTSLQALRDAKRHCLLDIDVQGVQELKRLVEQDKSLKPKFVFVAPPSLSILLARLSSRGTESAEDVERRTANARAEVEYGMEEGNFDRIVVNDDLDRACHEFSDIVKELYSAS